MDRTSSPRSAEPARPTTASDRLAEAALLLERMSGGAARVVPFDLKGGRAGLAVNTDWCVGGDTSDPRVAAAAEILRMLAGSETEIESLCSEILDRYEEASLVYRMADRLGEITEEEEIARVVLEDAARVLGADSGEVWLRRGAAVERVARLDGDAQERPEDRRAPMAVLERRRPWTREAGADREAAVAVPLPVPGADPIGVLVLRGRPGGRSYRTGEIKLLGALSVLMSSFIRNARLAAKARIAEARRRADQIAEQIHFGLLPREDPTFPGLEISGRCRASEQIGGDYYGYLELPDGSLAVAMADVSGHGVGAGLYMAAAKGALLAESRRVASPSELLRRTNDALVADFSHSGVFATAYIARFPARGDRVHCASGGHHPPVLVRADGSVDSPGAGGLALGVMPGVLYREESWSFEHGDVLVLFTDGLIEARNDRREFYGRARVERVARETREASAPGIRQALLADLDRFLGKAPISDDVTLVVIKAAGRAGEVREGGHA